MNEIARTIREENEIHGRERLTSTRPEGFRPQQIEAEEKAITAARKNHPAREYGFAYDVELGFAVLFEVRPASNARQVRLIRK